jgi:hypothetical protein
VEVVESQPPSGQQFILRYYLREVFARAPFSGDSWTSCESAFLQTRGIPLLMQNGVSQAPASFFLNLYTSREPTYPPEGERQWGETELRKRLAGLGEQRLTMLITSDGSRSWVVYLNEGLTEVLAYHGRSLPGPRYSPEDDAEDVTKGTFVRHLASNLIRTKIIKLDHSELPAASVELADASGHHYAVRFERWLRLSAPSPGNEDVISVDEIRGPSGRTWFIFEPTMQDSGRKLAVQADSASWTQTD